MKDKSEKVCIWNMHQHTGLSAQTNDNMSMQIRVNLRYSLCLIKMQKVSCFKSNKLSSYKLNVLVLLIQTET